MKMNNIEIRDVPYGPAGFGHEICVRDEAGDWVRILMSDDEAEAVAKHLAKMVNVHRGGGLCDEVGFVYWRTDHPAVREACGETLILSHKTGGKFLTSADEAFSLGDELDFEYHDWDNICAWAFLPAPLKRKPMLCYPEKPKGNFSYIPEDEINYYAPFSVDRQIGGRRYRVRYYAALGDMPGHFQLRVTVHEFTGRESEPVRISEPFKVPRWAYKADTAEYFIYRARGEIADQYGPVE